MVEKNLVKNLEKEWPEVEGSQGKRVLAVLNAPESSRTQKCPLDIAALW